MTNARRSRSNTSRASRARSSAERSASYESSLSSAAALAVSTRSMCTASNGRRSIAVALCLPWPAQPDDDAAANHRHGGEADADLCPVLFHEVRRALAVQDREVALAKIPDAAPHH